LCGDGQEAFLRLQAQADAFDVVLMDVQMPVLDGHDPTRRIRLELELLPIIELTAGALMDNLQFADALKVLERPLPEILVAVPSS
jgi:CheY-like chemotaxis protein